VPLELVVKHLLDSWGFDPEFSIAFSSLASSLTASPVSSPTSSPARPDLAPARVVSDRGFRLEVVDASGAPRLAVPSGRLRHTSAGAALPAVGDWVAVAAAHGPADPVVIHGVLPRRTQLIRRAAGRSDRDQVIATNIDTVLVVTSANRDARARRLERQLTAVWDSGAAAVVVVSKSDLVDAAALAAILADIAASAPSVPVIAVSVRSGAGLAELAALLRPAHTVALMGSSGVGKSSLVNHWLGVDHQLILPIDADDRGRHATTRRELFALPGGALVIDTPGMRSFGLLDTDTGLDETFADVTALAANCRFRNCQHHGEPGCAVEAAIDAGELDPERRDSYDQLVRELVTAARRRDPALARDELNRLKARNRALRARSRIDPKLRR
jgi:ribosome biogenesis GTPase